MTSRAAVRDLRQNLSKYLDRVKAGERFEVTERGTPVAMLVPLDDADDPVARMEAEGLVVRRAAGSIDELGPPPPAPPGPATAELLDEQREERL
ncbi:MAG: type II toxin-antitoxin system prevent-host-death family antitoxin [Thermoleophilia bacterium]|nr:type II toxin-antitoxin system prevent-host-death family antitoxin [Thermoleophilia bacterium]